MLFDLRSRGRRRVIQVVYGFLALLIGGGLVFFGVGGGAGSTGLLSQLAQQGTGSATGVKIDETAVARAQRAVKASPDSAAVWDRYSRAVFALADTNYVTSESGFTSAGAKELTVLKSAWNRYLSLNPPKPDPTLAADVVFAFGQSGIDEYQLAETGQEIVAENDNSADSYATLAAYAYLAHEPDRAKLAEAKALSLAPKSERKTLESELATVAAQASGATGASGSTGASG
jgi:hypothetical protein